MSTFDLSKQSYDIKPELIFRKILEEWDREFNENYENPFDYDLGYYRHIEDDSSSGYRKVLIGYIEVERYSGNNWICGQLPKNWFELSFLKRKIFKYDMDLGVWINEPKDNYEITIYVKLNHDYTDCFCVSMIDLVKYGKESRRSDGSYNNSFIVLPIHSDYLTLGLDCCVSFIENFDPKIIESERICSEVIEDDKFGVRRLWE